MLFPIHRLPACCISQRPDVMHDEPLIYTSIGNYPVSLLDYETHWEKTDQYTKFIETYSLNGEIVRESAHVLAHEGISSAALIPQI